MKMKFKGYENIEKENLLNIEGNLTENKKRNFHIPKKLFFSIISLLLLSFSVNYLSFSSNLKLKRKNREISAKNIYYEGIIQDQDKKMENLRRLNKEAIIVLSEKIDELNKQMPMRELLSPLKSLVGGVALYNDYHPISTRQLEKIIQSGQNYNPQQYLENIINEVESYPKKPKEIWENWRVMVHGRKNYIPKVPEIHLPVVGYGKESSKDEENTIINLDMGYAYYIVIVGEGSHNGFDISNKDGSKAPKLYASFSGKILEDKDYKGKGRTISILADYKGENGEMYKMSASHFTLESKRWKYGQKIREGDYVGDVGTTGFVSGPHAHVEFYVSYNRGKKWELFNPFEKGTYLEQERIVWFVPGDNPEEMPISIRNRLEKFLNHEKNRF